MRWAIHYRWRDVGVAVLAAWALAVFWRCSGDDRFRVSAASWMKARSGCAARSRPAPGRPKASAWRTRRAILCWRHFRKYQCHQPGGPPGRWHRHHRLLQYRILRRSEAERAMASGVSSGQRRADRRDERGAGRRFRASIWNFSQPIADNMEEAVSGVKGQLAIKIYGDDLKSSKKKATRSST